MNLNTGFYKDLDTNFEQACYLSEHKFTHSELVDMLYSGNIPQKQIAALKFDSVGSIDDALALVLNLTGCDGKIREAVALTIFRQMTNNQESRKLFAQTPVEIFADATIDINANICRLVVDSVKTLNTDANFAFKYASIILDYAKSALDELALCVFNDKKYVKNKQLFKLYWCLETMKNFYSYADENLLFNILTSSAAQSEYTIREKVAQISLLSEKFSGLRIQLMNDSNYYVRTVYLNH